MRIALFYPNTFRAGGAYLGLAVLYRIINQTPGLAAERFFLPPDGQPLLSRESQSPINRFSLLLVSLAFENDAPNLLAMLKRAGIALKASERARQPLVIVGGIVPMLNPEPLAEIADALLLGEAEVVLQPLLAAWQQSIGMGREKQLLRLAQKLDFLYVPSLYAAAYDQQGLMLSLRPLADVPARVKAPKYTGPADGLASSLFLSPEAEMGDMYLQELGRGCAHGCRFCAAGHIYLPPRLGRAEDFQPRLLDMAARGHKLGLVSAAVNDIPGLDKLANNIVRAGGSFSVSSLRADTVSASLLEALVKCGQKTFSMAPEAGSQRLRELINKKINQQDLARATEMAIEAGMLNMRLYFMLGLPGEGEEDLRELAGLVEFLRERMLHKARSKGRMGQITVSLNPFIPKPFTPMQWQPMALPKQLAGKLKAVKKALGPLPNVRVISESTRLSLLQAAISRGDRRLGQVLMALSEGQTRAFATAGLPAEFFACRRRGYEEYLPWQIVDHGLSDDYLYRRAVQMDGILNQGS